MAIGARDKNNTAPTTYLDSTTKYTTPALCYVNGSGSQRYLPLIKPDGTFRSGDNEYYYDSSKPAIHGVDASGVHRVVPNAYRYATSLPAGTYTASQFQSFISRLISSGSYRTVKTALNVTVNKQTITMPAGGKLYFRTIGTSPYGAQLVGFNSDVGTQYPTGSKITSILNSSNGFTNNRQYAVSNTGGVGGGYAYVFKQYNNYPITLSAELALN